MNKQSSPKPDSKLNIGATLLRYRAVFAIVLALIGVVIIYRTVFDDKAKFEKKIIPEAVKKVMSNPNSKFDISGVKKANGVYEFTITYQGQKFTSYITTNGKILFVQGIKLDEIGKTAQQQSSQKKLTCNDIPKADKANLTAFIVANCPYGLQTQRVIKKLLAELPNSQNNVSIKYIGSVENGKITSMHGDEEAKENLRQICIREEQSDLYIPYLSCYMQEGKADDCLANTGVNQETLNACMTDNKKGLSYAKKDFDLASKFNIGSSPTLLINNKTTVSESDFGGRNPESLKQIICCGSKTKPDYCSTEASKTDVAVAYSITDEPQQAGASSSAASCATQ